MKITLFRERPSDGGQPDDDRWAVCSPQKIPAKDGSGDTYLFRYRIIKTPFGGIYLHHILMADTDRDPHDHPFRFWSFVLSGGYSEEIFEDLSYDLGDGVLCAERIYRRRWLRHSWHRMDTNAAHMITRVLPKTKTLVFVGPRVREWGFWTQTAWVHWVPYVKQYYAPLPDVAEVAP